MLRNLLKCYRPFSGSKVKTPTIQEVNKFWSDYSQGYNTFDYAPQSLYYSLLYMSEPWKANSILEVACGTGKLLPFAMKIKKPEAKYVAVDLASEMIDLAKKNTEDNFAMYDSKNSYE